MDSLIPIIETAGYFGVFGIVFAESGLLFGFMLPGDTLLFAAGLLASDGHFNIVLMVIGCFIAAVAGDSVGYWVGKRAGPKIFKREDSFFFKKAHIAKAEAFFEKHGVKTIILARYLPIVRTFAPVLAGVANMKYRTFITYNIVGGALWCSSLILTGYFLGEQVPHIDRYIVPIVIGIFVLSTFPVVMQLLKKEKDPNAVPSYGRFRTAMRRMFRKEEI